MPAFSALVVSSMARHQDFTYNYYRCFGSVVSDVDNNNLAEDLAKRVSEEEKYFIIFVDDNLEFDLVYDQLFSSDLFLFKKYIEQANTFLGYDALQTSVSVIKRDWLNTIIVELNYN